MADNKYNIIKAASWYTIGNILIRSVGFFVLPIFTRLMNTQEYGIYSIYTSYLTIFETTVLLGLSSTVTLARYAKEVKFDSYISTIIAIPTILTVVCMIIANVFITKYGDILSMNATLWNCLFITAGSGAICNIIGAKLVIEGKYMLYLGYSGINVLGNILISLLLSYTIYRTDNTHLARVFGNTAAALICVVFLMVTTKTKMGIKYEEIKYAIMWGIPLLFHTLATVVLTQSDRIMIRLMDSYSSAGIYAVATTVVSIPMVVQQSLCHAWTPWFYGKLDVKNYKQIRWLNDRYIIFYSVITAGFMLLTPDVIYLFTEKSYWGCIYSLVPLAVSTFAEMLYSIPTSVEYYNRKTNYIMTATIITVFINVALDFLFIFLFGYHGAAYATVLSKILLFLIQYGFSRRVDRNGLFNNKIIIITIALLLALDGFIVLTLKWFAIRYILLILLILPIGLYVIKNKQLLISKFREELF